ncbi:hypothetical protein [Nannocystis radixulma]|uniref:Uncharacterized protein n=1 Tax=Nannocystis radixulma TaxID=2995305 RepID=A0ABT5B5M0_9BACT|nr:hypothetical protein [Nannocystis radixulma]MDC0669392.1 hypothetical protein [Nannocystis radixulma]
MKHTERLSASLRLAGGALLSATVALSGTVASAAPPAGEEQRYRDLEAASKLDLSRDWAAYTSANETEAFADYVDRRFRLRRDVGRGLVMAGGVTILAATFAWVYGLTDSQPRGRPSVVTGHTLGGISVGLWLVGGILWGVYAKRLNKLEAGTLAFGPRGRVRLQGAAPILLPRGAGLGLSLSF